MDKLAKQRLRRKLRNRYHLVDANKKKFDRVYFNVTNKNLYAQLIETETGKTLLTVSTLNLSNNAKKNFSNRENAEKLAELFADKAKQFLKNDKKIIFDRGAKLYHGKVKIFGDALHKKGIKI